MKNAAVVDGGDARYGQCAVRRSGVCQQPVRILSAVVRAGTGRSTSADWIKIDPGDRVVVAVTPTLAPDKDGRMDGGALAVRPLW